MSGRFLLANLISRQEMDVDRGIAAHTATFVAWHWITDIPQNLRLFLHVPSKLLGSCDASEAPLVKHAEGGASQLRYSKYVLEKWMNNSRMSIGCPFGRIFPVTVS